MRLYNHKKDRGLWLATSAWLNSLGVHLPENWQTPSFYHKDKYSRMFVFGNGMQLTVYASPKYKSDETDPLNWLVSSISIKAPDDE